MLQAILLVLAVSVDAFFACVSYGAGNIKIPVKSAVLIAAIGSAFLMLSLSAAFFLQQVIPASFCKTISFALLCGIGVFHIFQVSLKKYLKKICDQKKSITFKLSNFDFILHIYADEKTADADHSKTLSAKEAFFLALALSVDSLATGFGGGLGMENHIQVVILSFVIGITAIGLGSALGKCCRDQLPFNFSWFSGILLIAMAFLRFL